MTRDIDQVVSKNEAITPGSWVDSKQFGECVCIENHSGQIGLRYEAIHYISGLPIWVRTADEQGNCTFLRSADDLSRRVLTLTSPYGHLIG